MNKFNLWCIGFRVCVTVAVQLLRRDKVRKSGTLMTFALFVSLCLSAEASECDLYNDYPNGPRSPSLEVVLLV